LGRGPQEPTDETLAEFYGRLLDVLRQPVVRRGAWRLLECVPAWEGNWTWDCFLAYSWEADGRDRLLVAVNYADHRSQCFVRLPFVDLAGATWRLEDQLERAAFDRDGGDLQARGLYLDLAPWEAAAYCLHVVPRDDDRR
jgi:hypothetical protein